MTRIRATVKKLERVKYDAINLLRILCDLCESGDGHSDD